MIAKSRLRASMTADRAMRAITRSWHSIAGVILILLCALATHSLAATGDPARFRAGLRNSAGRHQLNAKQLDAVLQSLRHKTGFLEMYFAEDGFLTLGDRTRIAGGSATARALLVATVDGAQAIELENHSGSPLVLFAQLAPPLCYTSHLTGARITAQSLELDLFDFAQLMGDREVLTAFDLGFAVLHELAHAVLHLQDDKANPKGLGACEDYINRIRRELELPERQHYIARIRETTLGQTGKKVELSEVDFIRQRRGKTERFRLSWETQKAGETTDHLKTKATRKNDLSTIATR